MRRSVVEAVEKALSCGDIKKGYAKFKCIECDGGHEVIAGHSCKSRFCNRCGKVYVEDWVNKQAETVPDITHRHTVFTVPEELRNEIETGTYWKISVTGFVDCYVTGMRRWAEQGIYAGSHYRSAYFQEATG